MFQPGSMNYTQGFGSSPNSVAFPHIDVRAPTSRDVLYALGTNWLDKVAGNYYVLGNFSTVDGVTSANWAFLGATSGDLNSLTTQDLTVVTPTAGTIVFNGVANQLTTTGSNAPGTVNVGLVNAVVAPGSLATTTTLASGTTLTAGTSLSVTTSVTVGTSITSTLGNITATNGNLVLGTAGNKIVSTSVGTTTAAGANSFGSVTLSGGTATVSTTAVTANSLIVVWRQTVGATGAAALGHLCHGTIVAGTSFVINSNLTADATALATTDVSVVGWMIIN